MHFKSLRHVRDHVKVQGRAYDLLMYIALHTHMHTGEAFELTIERQALRHQLTPEWTRILLNGVIATGELVVERSRGRHPNRYRFPLERCHANPKVIEASTPRAEPIEPQKEVKELKEYKEGPTPNVAHARDKAETASPFWCPDCGYAIPACGHRTAYRMPPRQEVTRPALVWGVRLAVHPASP